MKPSVVVEFKNVNFSYNATPVLENINLTIRDRDFLGIIGPNGGGKTTLLKLMLGLLTPNTGEISVFGKPVRFSRHLIGYVPQLFNFDFDFPISVLEVVLMGRLKRAAIGRRYNRADLLLAQQALEKVGMTEFRDREIGTLSGGQRQRVFIARALTTNPKILLLDEPVASIDTKWQAAFFELLDQLNTELAIVLVTHDVSVISSYINLIACVNRKIHFHGATKDGIHQISKMYHCPVDLVAHSMPHRSLQGH